MAEKMLNSYETIFIIDSTLDPEAITAEKDKFVNLITANGEIGEVYNIGGHNEKHNIEVVKEILKALGKPESLITYVSDRKGHDLRYAIDPTKIETKLGWKPKYTFETGIKETIEWFMNNQEWMDDVTSGDYLKYYEQMYQ